jgi:ABC-type branched-subunit amino acid transport system substrate-binding protein
MKQRTRWAALLAALVFVVVACQSSSGRIQQAVESSARTGNAPAGRRPGSAAVASRDQVRFDVGVTKQPCPERVNPQNGCIYLGTISDLSGPFSVLGVPSVEAQRAFWKRVNNQGGIGGFDVNVTRYVRDNKYDPATHKKAYEEIKNNVLALAETLGSPTTAAIIDDLTANGIVAVPASWTSAWAYENVIMESGNNYCTESMNAVDFALRTHPEIKTVMAVHLPGDYGDDGAAGAKIGAQAHNLRFVAVPQAPTATGATTDDAVKAIVTQKPDLVVLTVTPRETASIVGTAVAHGYKGLFIGNGPTWAPPLLQSPAAEALRNHYLQAAPWGSFDTQTPGHQAMRAALGNVKGNDGYVFGWVWSYPLKAALEQAIRYGDLTRKGLLAAVRDLQSVNYEGMLPEGAGDYADDPNDGGTVRQTLIQHPDDATQSGVSVLDNFSSGPTAAAYTFTGPCFQVVNLQS